MSWEVSCKPTEKGGLGILYLLTLDEALQSKWVSRIMNAGEEMTVKVLKDRYDIGLDWDRGAALVCRAYAFWLGVRRVFPKVRDFFIAKIGYDLSFRYWHDSKSSRGIL